MARRIVVPHVVRSYSILPIVRGLSKANDITGLRKCPHPNLRPSHKALYLPLVCRRFRSISQPLFYRHIEIWPLPESFCRFCRDPLASLHATLRDNLALARHCHTLMISHWEGLPASFTAHQYLEDFCHILSLMTNLRCLKLVAFPPDTRGRTMDSPGPLARLWERLRSINHVLIIDVMHQGDSYGLSYNMMHSRSNLCDRVLQIYGYVPISRSDITPLKVSSDRFLLPLFFPISI
jgi:hypothetical protein